MQKYEVMIKQYIKPSSILFIPPYSYPLVTLPVTRQSIRHHTVELLNLSISVLHIKI